MFDQIRTVDRRRMGSIISTLNESQSLEADKALKLTLNLS